MREGTGAGRLGWVGALLAAALVGVTSSALAQGGATDWPRQAGGGPPAEFGAFIRAEQKIWSDIVRRANIRAD